MSTCRSLRRSPTCRSLTCSLAGEYVLFVAVYPLIALVLPLIDKWFGVVGLALALFVTAILGSSLWAVVICALCQLLSIALVPLVMTDLRGSLGTE